MRQGGRQATMLDYKKEIVNALSPILPTYYDYIRDDTMSFPCITYVEFRNDQDQIKGNNICFSTIGYTIRIWGNDIGLVTEKAKAVDSALRRLGYTRIGSQESIVSGEICKILLYTAYAEEHF